VIEISGNSMARVYGYSRPTLSHPDPEAHAQRLAEAGAEQIFIEKNSGQARRGARERRRLLDRIAAGDRLILLSLDRLGTSIEDVLRCFNLLVARGVDVTVQNRGFETGRLPGSPELLDMLVGTLSALHSETIKLNLAAARAKGGRASGKPASLTPDQWPDIKARIGDASLETVAQELGVSRQTLWTYRRRMAEQDGIAAS
jgi:DNA invertase Pin-like site-specific DNA recombinase